MTVKGGRSIGGRLAVTGLVLGAIGIAWFATRPAPRAADPEPADPGTSFEAPRTEELAPAAAPTPRSAEPLAEDPTPGRTIEVRVLAHARPEPDSAPVPGIALEVGLYDPARPIVTATALTGNDGHALVTLGWTPDADEDPERGPMVWARPLEPALRGQLASTPILADATRVDLAVWAGAGTWIRGRVVNAEGEPVRATVQLGEGDDWAGLGLADPSFEFEARTPGPWTLLADAGEHGTGRQVVPPAPAGRPPLPVVLRVTGPGVVRGRLVDVRGEPLAGRSVLVGETGAEDRGETAVESVAAAAAARAAGSYGLLLRLDGERIRATGGGQIAGVAVTDAEGLFEVRGLLPGLYRVRTARDGRRLWMSMAGAQREALSLLTPEPIPADGFERTFVLRRPHLVVHLVDPSGAPFEGEVGVRAPSRDHTRADGLQLHVLELGADEGSARRSGDALGRGVVLFELEGDRTYRVALFGAGQPWRPVDVSVAPDDDALECRLTVEPTGPLGTLVVRRSEGTAYCGLATLVVECPETGVTLARDGFGGEARLELPPGRWRVAVEDAPVVDTWHGMPLREPCLGRFEAEIDVVAGREQTLLVTPPAGARLALAIEGRPDASDRSALGMEGAPTGRRDPAAWVQLHLLAPRRASVPVRFVWEDLEPPVLKAALPLGANDTSWVLPAGRWTLEGRLPGGRVARTEVVLVDGETTEARLAFE